MNQLYMQRLPSITVIKGAITLIHPEGVLNIHSNIFFFD